MSSRLRDSDELHLIKTSWSKKLLMTLPLQVGSQYPLVSFTLIQDQFVQMREICRLLANQLLDFSGFVLLFVLISSLDLQGHLLWSWRPSLVVMYIGLWALEDPVSMVCSVFFFWWCCFLFSALGVVHSHLLLRWSSSKCCNMASTWVKPSVTDFTIQVTTPLGCCTAT